MFFNNSSGTLFEDCIETTIVNLLLGEITMRLFTTILILALFSGFLSAQNSKTNLPVNSNYKLNDESNSLRVINQSNGTEKQIAELAGSVTGEMISFEGESFSGFSKKAEVNQQNKISELKETISVSEKKTKISYCNYGACDIETSNTGFWVFISSIAFAVSFFIGKGN